MPVDLNQYSLEIGTGIFRKLNSEQAAYLLNGQDDFIKERYRNHIISKRFLQEIDQEISIPDEDPEIDFVIESKKQEFLDEGDIRAEKFEAEMIQLAKESEVTLPTQAEWEEMEKESRERERKENPTDRKYQSLARNIRHSNNIFNLIKVKRLFVYMVYILRTRGLIGLEEFILGPEGIREPDFVQLLINYLVFGEAISRKDCNEVYYGSEYNHYFKLIWKGTFCLKEHYHPEKTKKKLNLLTFYCKPKFRLGRMHY